MNDTFNKNANNLSNHYIGIARLDIKPAFNQNNVPVVFGCDENYLRYLKVTLKSILANTDDRNLDILIFHDSLTDEILDDFILNIPK